MSREDRRTGRNKRRLIGCLALCLGAPFILAVAFIITWSVNNRPPRIDLPKPVVPAVNAVDDFHRAFLLAGKMQHKSPYSMPVPPAQANTDANFAACAADAAPVIAAVRVGLTHPYVAPPGPPNSPTPRFAEDRELARILAGAAEHYRRTGRYGEGMAILLDGMHMAAKIPHGDAIIGYLVAHAVEAICLAHVEELIPKLSEGDLKKTAQTLDRIVADRAPLGDIIREEGAQTTASWIAVFKDPKTASNPLTSRFYEQNRFLVDAPEAFNFNNNQPPAMTMQQRMELARFGLANKERMLRENLACFEAIAKECDETAYQPTLRTKLAENLLIRYDGGMLQKWRRMRTASDAALAVLRTEVALERYRKAHGRYPASLTELAPAMMAQVLDDPFAGARAKPLTYRPAPDGRSYTLYSLGGDMKDDRGTPTRFYAADDPGDIVAGQLAPKRSGQ